MENYIFLVLGILVVDLVAIFILKEFDILEYCQKKYQDPIAYIVMTMLMYMAIIGSWIMLPFIVTLFLVEKIGQAIIIRIVSLALMLVFNKMMGEKSFLAS